jgi:hypothetical protein
VLAQVAEFAKLFFFSLSAEIAESEKTTALRAKQISFIVGEYDAQ